MSKIQLTRDQFEDITYRVEDYDPDVTFRPNYSGRGMYGRTCVGVVHNDGNTPAAFLYILADELGMDFLDLLSSIGSAQDGMGLSTVTYFSGITVAGAQDEDEEDDD
jgi:hypothetical protein